MGQALTMFWMFHLFGVGVVEDVHGKMEVVAIVVAFKWYFELQTWEIEVTSKWKWQGERELKREMETRIDDNRIVQNLIGNSKNT